MDGRRDVKFQEWVALQPFWLVATLALPTSAVVIYASVPPAIAVVWGWRRRLLPSPTVIGMVTFPAVYSVARHMHVAPTDLIVGQMIPHKIIVSIIMITAYGLRETARQVPILIRWLASLMAKAIANEIETNAQSKGWSQ